MNLTEGGSPRESKLKSYFNDFNQLVSHFTDLPVIIKRLESGQTLNSLMSLLISIRQEENKFALNEVVKRQTAKFNPEIDLNEQIFSNAQIFKSNLKIVIDSLSNL